MDFGNLFSALGRALPGFVEGRQQAIKDNWQDLKEYNTTEKGQLQNMWTEATWKPALTNAYMNTAQQALNLFNSGMNTALEYGRLPGRQEEVDILNQFKPGALFADLQRLTRGQPTQQQQQQLPGAIPATLPTMDGDNGGINDLQRTK